MKQNQNDEVGAQHEQNSLTFKRTERNRTRSRSLDDETEVGGIIRLKQLLDEEMHILLYNFKEKRLRKVLA